MDETVNYRNAFEVFEPKNTMRSGPSIVIVLALLVSVGAALAGYLHGEIVSVDAGGSVIRVTWSQGVTTDYSVVDRIGNSVSGLSPLVVNEGPNSCNDDHPVMGNGRAYYVSVASDHTGPQDPDGWVDCNLCDCETNPGTNFECNSINGQCAQCDACEPGGSAACGSRSDGNTRCEHVTCSSYDCVCDTVDCADRATDWGSISCTYSGSAECGPVTGSKSRTAYGCSGDSCVSTGTESQSCSTNAGTCPSGETCESGTCESCECDDCRSKVQCPNYRACTTVSGDNLECRFFTGEMRCPEDLSGCPGSSCEDVSDCGDGGPPAIDE